MPTSYYCWPDFNHYLPQSFLLLAWLLLLFAALVMIVAVTSVFNFLTPYCYYPDSHNQLPDSSQLFTWHLSLYSHSLLLLPWLKLIAILFAKSYLYLPFFLYLLAFWLSWFSLHHSILAWLLSIFALHPTFVSLNPILICSTPNYCCSDSYHFLPHFFLFLAWFLSSISIFHTFDNLTPVFSFLCLYYLLLYI